MSASTDINGTRPRLGARAAFLLAILVVSVGAAWWLTRSRGRSARRGADIIRELRRRTLTAYWQPQTVIRAYLATDRKGRSVGWRLDMRTPTEDGYAGRTWLYTSQSLYSSQWQASADLTKGRYEGRAWMGSAPVLSAQTRKVSIVLADQRVHVSVWQLGRSGLFTGESHAPAPGNYIPEGLLPVVVRLAAAGNNKASLRMISDADSIRNGRVNFTTVTIDPKGSARAEASVGEDRIAYNLDRQGQIVRIEYLGSGQNFTVVPVAEMLREFPGAGEFLDTGT